MRFTYHFPLLPRRWQSAKTCHSRSLVEIIPKHCQHPRSKPNLLETHKPCDAILSFAVCHEGTIPGSLFILISYLSKLMIFWFETDALLKINILVLALGQYLCECHPGYPSCWQAHLHSACSGRWEVCWNQALPTPPAQPPANIHIIPINHRQLGMQNNIPKMKFWPGIPSFYLWNADSSALHAPKITITNIRNLLIGLSVNNNPIMRYQEILSQNLICYHELSMPGSSV